jgi:ABC-type siderophore export system fused ATPase/permease subunit
MYYFIKIIITCVFIIAVSEISKRSSFFGAIIASIPIISVLGIIWLYFDTKNVQMIITLSNSIFWLVIPSLAFFVILPVMLKAQVNFTVSLLISIVVTVCCYFLMVFILSKFGVKL